MSGAPLSFLRRLGPRRMRTRLAVFYTLLFLAIGVVLLAVTYLVSAKFLLPHAAPPPKQLSPQEQSLFALCKPLPTSGPLVAQCKHLIKVLGVGPGALSSLRVASMIGFGVFAVLAAVLGWLVAGRALRPVRSMTEAARRASELRLGERLALTGPDDELKELADAFDVMLERLDAAFTSQRRFIANAAHELRTPLTAMRTAIEVTLSKPARTPEQLEAMAIRVKQSLERAEQTVEALLTLATSEAGATVREPVDLANAAEEALAATSELIAQGGMKVDAELDPAPTAGDRVLLERMVANLVDNAVRHNVEDGWIGVRTLRRDGSVAVEVANTGPPVAAEQIPALLEPFARAAERLSAGDGVGLGLSIASAIAAAHGTAIDARPREGGGLDVSVTLPVDPEVTDPTELEPQRG